MFKLCLLPLVCAYAALAPSRLRVEYIKEPRGVDVVKPRFSWSLNHAARNQIQQAYQIVVSKSDGVTVSWDSGKITSAKSLNIQYAGSTPLESDTAYSWKVKYWDGDSKESPYSSPGSFTMGLLTQADWKGAKWIGATTTAPGRQFRVAFNTKKEVSRATAYCVGLGYYKMHVNGEKVSTHELGPFLTFEKRVYYDSIDVTAALKSQPSGSHTLGITLGNGWYNQPKVAKFTKASPKLLLRLSITMADGTTMDVVSGAGAAAGAWQQHISPITMDDIYAGETYNATLETPDWTILGSDSDSGSDSGNGWAPVQEVPSPSANTTISSHAVLPPIRVGQTFSPCDMWQSSPGVYVFDFCQNMAGFTTLRIPAGLTAGGSSIVSMLHAEV